MPSNSSAFSYIEVGKATPQGGITLAVSNQKTNGNVVPSFIEFASPNAATSRPNVFMWYDGTGIVITNSAPLCSNMTIGSAGTFVPTYINASPFKV